MNDETRIVLIGFGAMGHELARMIRASDKKIHIVAVATRAQPDPQTLSLLPAGVRVVNTPEQLGAIEADLAVECAGHAALAQYGPVALRRGHNLLVASVGALANIELESVLRASAETARTRILIPSGALGGLDALSAARLGGLSAVTYTGRKPPRAWKGTRAEQSVRLDDPDLAAIPFFDGTARQAALEYPLNANVTAAVSIAGLGFDATRVQLFADPAAAGNEHRIQASGAFGRLEMTVNASPLPDNPKTSMLAPCSLARSLFNLRETLVLV
jgi:aspartate dehydrogenase